MRIFSFLAFILLLLSCSSDDVDSSNIVGKWKLTQVLADPGDGSGTFVDVESNKTIIFLSDETFSSNGNLCVFGSITPVTTEGVFSTEDEIIYPSTCESFARIGLNYTIEDGALTIFYQCIEACAEKYKKIA